MSSSFDPDAPATLLELVTGLQVILDASAVTATKRSQIAIVVLTGFMAIASPLLFYRLWSTGKLWFFRLQRRSQGTYLVAHPLAVFSAFLSLTGVLILGCIIVKYKYAGASITPEALPMYTSVVLTSWIVLPIGPMYTILGTICAIPERDAGSAWHHKVRRTLGGPLFMNMLNTLAPLAWIVVTTAFAVKTTVHFNNAYDTSTSLQRQLAQGLVASATATATTAQMATAHRAWDDFLAGFDSIRIVAIVWAATVCVLVVSILVVGARICCILRRQLRQLRTGLQNKPSQQVAEEARYIRDSIIVLGSFYILLAVSGIILLVAMCIAAAQLDGQNVTEALDSYRLLQLVYMWTVSVNGTGAIVLFSGRVFAAASVGAIAKGPMLRRRRAGPDTETADAVDGKVKLAWAKTGFKRTSGILDTPKGSRPEATAPCASMTGSGVKVDIEEEMVMDVADLHAVSIYKSSGSSSSASSTPMTLLTKLPGASPSITDPAPLPSMEEEHQTLPPWER